MSDVCWSCSSPLSKRFCRSCGADSGCPSCGEIALGRFCRSCGFDVSAKRGIPLASPDPTGPTVSEVEEVPVVVDEEPSHLDSTELDAETSGLAGATVVAAGTPDGSVGPPLAETAADDPSEPLDNPSRTAGRNRKFLFSAVAAVCVLAIVGLISLSVLNGSSDSASVNADSLVSAEIEAASTDTISETSTTTEAPAPVVTEPPARTENLTSPPKVTYSQCGPDYLVTPAQCQERLAARATWNAQIQEGGRIFGQCQSEATQLQENLQSLRQAADRIDPSDPSRAAADSAVAAAQISFDAKSTECARLYDAGLLLSQNPPRY